ncbi:hypothetical protein RFI_05137 [Reticulomyxa filosa]|uniref:Uncharacterized protein n=1 Tax=Reticulomyxa filosa TaxID=46433 RepID=X6P173_RETFI|nr:hypothetical protein RFI_05137 [Reticulomyxa filosa]|eukprot:ETO31981.1 hypothetical protein RFI_05137 [Reticulomyxa filosa]
MTEQVLILISIVSKTNKKYHVVPRRKEIDLTKIGCALIHHLTQLWNWNKMIDNMFQVFLRLKNFEINAVKYVNHHCNEAFEENKKIVDKLLHRLSQHGGKYILSYVNCYMETSRHIKYKFPNIEIRKLKKLLFDTD